MIGGISVYIHNLNLLIYIQSYYFYSRYYIELVVKQKNTSMYSYLFSEVV